VKTTVEPDGLKRTKSKRTTGHFIHPNQRLEHRLATAAWRDQTISEDLESECLGLSKRNDSMIRRSKLLDLQLMRGRCTPAVKMGKAAVLENYYFVFKVFLSHHCEEMNLNPGDTINEIRHALFSGICE
jgi:hypothetical protein